MGRAGGVAGRADAAGWAGLAVGRAGLGKADSVSTGGFGCDRGGAGWASVVAGKPRERRTAMMAGFMKTSLAESARRIALAFFLAFAVPAPVLADQWRGEYSAERRPAMVIARDAGQWRDLWAGLRAPPPRPLADGEAAVAIFLGPRRTGGYGLELIGTRVEGCATVVEFRETVPAGFVTQAFTSPWAVMTLPMPSGMVVAAEGETRILSRDLAEQSRCR
ncbi:protease complex subunit PrcB family protein [Magnetospirillum sp. SS-4]|uniref:protease complex subunit PrcB family protein n=1 Tax=Magnetospirillum sp. SS-4 TaxID=2681465 RepID=UPI00137E8FD2|nr:protease complex subunit PrcB family protein [Magnetospirillum sp. SS-4]CAA7617116.1 hypothetical protein MTBSS4_180072 [Magnetospirillum sp. SS-4]